MFVIKKLILVEWYRFFLASSMVLLILITVANLISGFLRGNVSNTEVAFNYLIELPAWLTKIFPISCLMASLFSINKLKNRNELTAIFASGYSRKKYIGDLILGSLLIAALQFVITAYVQPLGKKYRHVLIPDTGKFKNLGEKGLRTSSLGSGKIWYKTQDYFVSFVIYDKKNKFIKDVSLYLYDANKILEQKISAPEIYYKENRWFAPEATLMSHLNTMEFPKKSEETNFDFPLKERPSDFQQIESDVTTLSFGRLRGYINKLEDSGINANEYTLIYYNKIASSIMCIIFTLLAAVAIFRPNRRGASFGRSLGLVFVFTIFYWLIYSYTFELGQNGKLHPFLASFILPIFFIFIIVNYYYKHRKLR